MAKKHLPGIKFPGLDDEYMVTPLGLFTRAIRVDKSTGTATFWQQIEDVYSKMDNHTIEYCLGMVPWPYYPDDPDEPKGGVWVVEIYRSDKDFGYVSVRSYHTTTALGDIEYFIRSWYAGKWQNVYHPHKVDSIESADYPGCYYRHNAAGEVEWINPPMIDGVEYRTTERHEGKPVYIKRCWGVYLSTVSGQNYVSNKRQTSVPYSGVQIVDYTALISFNSGTTAAKNTYTYVGLDGGVNLVQVQLDCENAIVNPNAYPNYDMVITCQDDALAAGIMVELTVKYTRTQ